MSILAVRRAWMIVLMNVVAALVLTGFGPPKMVDRENAPQIRLTTGELEQWYGAAVPPVLSADALVLYDVDADRVIYSRNADKRLPHASLTKLMTALVVLESGRLEEQVTIVADDLIGGATMALSEGESLTVEELLWGLLVASGNDAAMALARHIGGNVETFVATMNRRAEELGLADTDFANPNGFDADGHFSSANDVLALTKQLLEYPLFQEIVATDETIVAGHPLVNTNELLNLYPGVDGVKTGTTPGAGECLVLSIRDSDRQLLIVVLGSDDRYADVSRLHELYLENYEWTVGDPKDLSVLNRLFGGDGELIPLKADGEPVTVLRHRWGDPDLVGFRNLEPVDTSNLERSQPVGAFLWRAGDVPLGRNELTVR